MTRNVLAPLLLILLITACKQPGDNSVAASPEAKPLDPAIYLAAIGNPARSSDDRARDAGRKPADVLEFFGIAPNMAVLDLFSGGGYYSEIVSHLTAGNGRVVAHSNEAYLNFVGDEFTARYADNRLPNVEILMAENNELALDADQFDAILMVLSYHDIYYAAPQRGWPKLDGPKLLAALYRSLKPGGILGIVDHYAEAGAPRDTGGTLHRIDPGIVIAELEGAGFELEAKGDMLRNTDDDYSKGVFDDTVRGKTDRFALRFRKPY